jgi:hypothetical protein
LRNCAKNTLIALTFTLPFDKVGPKLLQVLVGGNLSVDRLHSLSFLSTAGAHAAHILFCFYVRRIKQ